MKFLRAAALSAVAAFLATSWALQPQMLDYFSIDQVLAELRAPQQPPQAQPVPAAQSAVGQVQTSFADCREFFPAQQPPVVPAGPMLRELCFSSFAILYSGQRKTPVLVAQRLSRQMLTAGQSIPRTDRFYEEARLPSAYRARLADYRGSGYDRGHMAPAGDMATPEGMAQSFSLANMVPQDPSHNRGVWNKTEQNTRRYAMRAAGDVYVITGPAYGEQVQTIGEGRVAVPSHLFKLVHDPGTGKTWAHWQANSAAAVQGAPISYEEFVRRTGLRVLE